MENMNEGQHLHTDEYIDDASDMTKDSLDKLKTSKTSPKDPFNPTPWEKAAMSFEKEISNLPIDEIRSQREKLIHKGVDHGGRKYYNYAAKNIILVDKNGEEILVDMKEEPAPFGKGFTANPSALVEHKTNEMEKEALFSDEDEDEEW